MRFVEMFHVNGPISLIQIRVLCDLRRREWQEGPKLIGVIAMECQTWSIYIGINKEETTITTPTPRPI